MGDGKKRLIVIFGDTGRNEPQMIADETLIGILNWNTIL